MADLGTDRLSTRRYKGGWSKGEAGWRTITCKISPETKLRLKAGRTIGTQDEIVDAALQFYLDYKRVG